MNQEDANSEFIEAITNFANKIVDTDSLVPVIVDVGENVIDKNFMDDLKKKRNITDKDISSIAFIVANLVVKKFAKSICSMVEDGVLVPSSERAAELIDQIAEEEEEEEEDNGGLGDWLKLG
jgi:hypothetical protein